MMSIVTICGSTRFETQFKAWSEKLTMMGHCPITLIVYPSDKGDVKQWYTPDEKETLDLIHLDRINTSDAVLVLNIEGYIGDSTRREIKWAHIRRKDVYYVERSTDPMGIDVGKLPRLLPQLTLHLSDALAS